MLLLSFIAVGEMPVGDILELAKRVQIPGYELVRDLLRGASSQIQCSIDRRWVSIFSPKYKPCLPPMIKAGLAEIPAARLPLFPLALIWSVVSTPHTLGLLLTKKCRQPVLELGEDRTGVAIALELLLEVRNVRVQGGIFGIPSRVPQFLRSL